MTLRGIDPGLRDAVRAIMRAARRLEQGQGPIARRNAVQALRRATRGLLARVEAEYPVERRASTPRARRSPDALRRALERQGWKVVASAELLSRLAAAGVRVRRVAAEAHSVPGLGVKSARGYDTYAPAWALDIAARAPAKLVAARKNIQLRRALVTAGALQGRSA